MPLRPVASLAVKLLGLYAVISALPSLSLVLFSFSSGAAPVGVSPVQTAVLNALPGALQMLVGIGLWAFSDGIAHSLVKDEGDAPTTLPAGYGAILFSAVGALCLVEFSVELSRILANAYVAHQAGISIINIIGNSFSS